MAKKRRVGSKVKGFFSSLAGQPPRVQTGVLRRSIGINVRGLRARVGTGLAYGRYLELGTSKMPPHPWLRRALAESMGQIRAIFGA